MCEISDTITYHSIKRPRWCKGSLYKTDAVKWNAARQPFPSFSFPTLTQNDIAEILNTEPEFFHPYHQASCLSRGSQPRCYQTTSCLLLFSSSLTAFEVLKQLLIGAILYAGHRPLLRQRGVDRGCGCSDSSDNALTLQWGRGSVFLNQLSRVRGFLLQLWSVCYPSIRAFKMSLYLFFF